MPIEFERGNLKYYFRFINCIKFNIILKLEILFEDRSCRVIKFAQMLLSSLYKRDFHDQLSAVFVISWCWKFCLYLCSHRHLSWRFCEHALLKCSQPPAFPGAPNFRMNAPMWWAEWGLRIFGTFCLVNIIADSSHA